MTASRAIRRDTLVHTALFGALILYVWCGIHSAVTAWHGLQSGETTADFAVVFGAFVKKNGEPGYNLRRRLAKAVELYARGDVPYLLVSGGAGEGIRNEGRAMHRMLRELAVPDSAIIVDTTAANTFETARITRRIMDERGFRSAVIVTSYYHILRCRLALSRFGVTNLRTAYATISHEKRHPTLFFRPGMWWHEFAGFYWYLVRPLWWEG